MGRRFASASSEQIAYGTSAYFDADGLTLGMAAWVRVLDLSAERKIIARWGVDNQYLFSVKTDATVQVATSGGGFNVTSGGSVSIGRWVHIAATIDGTAQLIYVNGVLVNSASGNTFGAKTETLRIGTASDGGYHNGDIADAAVWIGARVLTPGQIRALADGQARPSDLQFANLRLYLSLDTDSDLSIGTRRVLGTRTGTTMAGRPPLLTARPSARRIATTAAAGGTGMLRQMMMGHS